MGTRERRVRHKQILREEILDAARELFLTEGYENVSMRRIAERIEYSPTTIYLYFQDKAEILDHLCAETFGLLEQRLATISNSPLDPLAKLRAGLRAYVDFGLEYPNHYQVTLMLAQKEPDPAQPCDRKMESGMRAFAHLRNSVENCVKSGDFREIDLETTAQALWAAVHGITSLLITHCAFPWTDRDRVINHLIEVLVEGLRV